MSDYNIARKYLSLRRQLHLQRGVQIFLNMEMGNVYWNLMKLNPTTWIMIDGFYLPFVTRLCTEFMEVILLVPVELGM